MRKLEKYINNHLHFLRRMIQLGTVLFIIAIPIVNKIGYHAVNGTFYSLSLGKLDIVDPALVLQTILLTKSIHLPLLIATVIPILVTLLFGKVFCSWVCPFNFLAEFSEKLRWKFKPPTTHRNRNPKPKYYWIVFGVILMMLIITGIPVITLISMPGLITSQIADVLFYNSVGIEVLLVFFLLILEILVVSRFWCKYACPVGATLAMVQSKRTLKIKYDSSKCAQCSEKTVNPCNKSCPINLNPKQPDIYPYCYNCFECIEVCNSFGGALTIKLNRPEIIARDKTQYENMKYAKISQKDFILN